MRGLGSIVVVVPPLDTLTVLGGVGADEAELVSAAALVGWLSLSEVGVLVGEVVVLGLAVAGGGSGLAEDAAEPLAPAAAALALGVD